ncbi:MAG: D-alanyl-D-alanine carboxypeptidase [Alphaproteobacteria bacterium]|nr:D-alanyl-D-alanine carboxypeptidase [Alphaproteobacteria bacterium]
MREIRGLAMVIAAATLVCSGAMVPVEAASHKAAKAPAAPKYVPPQYAAIVVDADSGAVLHAVDADVQTYPASLTKMMTLYLTFEALQQRRIQLEHRLPVSEWAASMAPSKLMLKPGSSIRLEEAILAVVTKSANDAAVVIGEALGGTEENFAQMMTQKARRLGMTRTVFQNASGLPNEAQVTTARDMALLGRALIYDFPQYYPYFNTRSFVYAGHVQANHNHLLASYDGADGIKTGFIRASGFNLVASAKRDNRRLIGVVFGGQSQPWRDNQMKRLLDQGFAREFDGTQMANVTDPVLTDTGPAPARLVSLKLDDVAPNNGAPSAGTPQPAINAKKPTVTNAALAIAPPPAPAKKGTKDVAAAPAAGGWLVQVGAFRGPAQASAASKAAIKAANLQGQVSVSPLQNGHSTLYRARVVGLAEAQARDACRTLERERIACVVVGPSGSVVH